MMKTLRGQLGVIVSVDSRTYTCTVRSEHGLHYDVPITPVFLSPNGQGMWFLPEVGTRVLVGTVGKGARNEYTFLIGAAFAVDQDSLEVSDDAVSDEGTDEEVVKVDFRNNRSVHQPGDIVLSSSDRNFIVMRKGGIIELGATQVAKRFYIPLQNVIRDLCQIYEMQNSAGIFQMVRKESDLTWGKTTIEVPAPAPDGETRTESKEIYKVPTELNLRVREFESDETPSISIDLGNITRTVMSAEGMEEDSSGARTHEIFSSPDDVDNGGNGLIHMLARLNINNKVRVFVDREGNYTTEVAGAEIHMHNGPRYEAKYAGHCIEEYAQNYIASYAQVQETIRTSKRTTVGQSATVSAGTVDDPETVWSVSTEGADLRSSGLVSLHGSKTTVSADGLLALDAGSDLSVSCDNFIISTMGSVDHVYSGPVSQTILNSDLGNVAYRIINESGGEIQLHNTLGEIRLSSLGRPSSGGQGGVGLPGAGSISQVRIKPNGTISVEFLAGGVITSSVEVNTTGAALTTAGGEISIDQAGFVNIGGTNTGAGNGRVVTTLTHPVCFVTGAPIGGSTTVGAFSAGLAPGPMTPTSFTLDPT